MHFFAPRRAKCVCPVFSANVPTGASVLKPGGLAARLRWRMGTVSNALPLPAFGNPVFGNKVAAKTRVDYENTPEGALVRRAQSGDEAAIQQIVQKYQYKVFSIIHS